MIKVENKNNDLNNVMYKVRNNVTCDNVRYDVLHNVKDNVRDNVLPNVRNNVLYKVRNNISGIM
jgi:hypothetical protein